VFLACVHGLLKSIDACHGRTEEFHAEAEASGRPAAAGALQPPGQVLPFVGHDHGERERKREKRRETKKTKTQKEILKTAISSFQAKWNAPN
jgi:hypothetical protein